MQLLPMDPAVHIGTLPNGLTYYIRANHWLGITPPKGIVLKDVHRGKEPKSQSMLVLTGTAEDSREN